MGLMTSQSRHSRRTLETQRSHRALALGARTGVRMTSRPAARKTASKAAGKLLSPIVDQEAGLDVFLVLKPQARFRACWGPRLRLGARRRQ